MKKKSKAPSKPMPKKVKKKGKKPFQKLSGGPSDEMT